MRTLLLCLLAGCSLVVSEERAPRQVYGNRVTLRPTPVGYLPPCHPTVVWQTKIVYSTVVIPSTVINNNAQTQTQTSIQVQQVTSTVFSDIVRTQFVPQIQFSTFTVTRTQGNVQTQFVTAPGQNNFVTRTQFATRTQVQFQTQFITSQQQIFSTITRNEVSTRIIPQQVVSTVFRTETITRSQLLPGQTRTIQSTRFSTVFSTIVQPGQNVVRTQFVTRTNFITQTVTQPGQTQFLTSTAVNPVTSTFFSNIAVTNTQTQFVTRTQFQQGVTTVVQTQQVPQFNTRTVTIPSQVIRTQFSTQVQQQTGFRTETAQTVVNLPAQTRVETIFQTSLRTQQLPGRTRTRFQTRVVFHTNYVTSTIINRQLITVEATRTVKPYCKTRVSYSRPTPTHRPYGR